MYSIILHADVKLYAYRMLAVNDALSDRWLK